MDGLSLDSLSFPQPISSEPSPQSFTPSHFHQMGTHCLLVHRNIQEWQVFWNHDISQLQSIQKLYSNTLQNKWLVLQTYDKSASVILTFGHTITGGGGGVGGRTTEVQLSSSEPVCPCWSWQSSSPSQVHERYMQRSFLHWRTKTLVSSNLVIYYLLQSNIYFTFSKQIFYDWMLNLWNRLVPTNVI